ncbi:MAG: polysaccharide deacetylase family protein (PEP-CTERM system associated) [Gammaproteobacteria bacterium]|jgi:polysaccharide deacetylase family protein (PEP-CTERM system associated)
MRNAMTVDVEDYFQVSAFEPYISRDSWDAQPCRVEGNVERILALFSSHNVKATFFTLGWVAERYPEMVRQIVAQGHEVASHGYSHVRATEQTEKEFLADVTKTKTLLEDISGVAVRGYRAATFSVARTNLWVWDALEEAGYEYSSSLNPIWHDLYGIPDAPRFAFRPNANELVEVPITTLAFAGRNYPCGGGGFFRLLPFWYFQWAYRRVNMHDRMPALFYFHPWEIDPDQPRQKGLAARAKFRHYTNLDKTAARIDKLLGKFTWARMDEIFLAPDFLTNVPNRTVV